MPRCWITSPSRSRFQVRSTHLHAGQALLTACPPVGRGFGNYATTGGTELQGTTDGSRHGASPNIAREIVLASPLLCGGCRGPKYCPNARCTRASFACVHWNNNGRQELGRQSTTAGSPGDTANPSTPPDGGAVEAPHTPTAITPPPLPGVGVRACVRLDHSPSRPQKPGGLRR